MSAQTAGWGRDLQGPGVVSVPRRRRAAGRAGRGCSGGGLRGGQARPGQDPLPCRFPPPGARAARGLAGAGPWGSPVVGGWGRSDSGLDQRRHPGRPGRWSGVGLGCGSPLSAEHRRELRGGRRGKARSLRLAWDRGSEWVGRVSGWLEPSPRAGRWWARCRSPCGFSLRRAPADVKGEEWVGGAPGEKGHGAGGCRASSGWGGSCLRAALLCSRDPRDADPMAAPPRP